MRNRTRRPVLEDELMAVDEADATRYLVADEHLDPRSVMARLTGELVQKIERDRNKEHKLKH